MPAKALHLLTQGNLNNISGGYIYNRELVSALEKCGFTITVHDIRSVSVIQQTLPELDQGSCVIVDSIIAETFAASYDHAKHALSVVYLCHLPMGSRPSHTEAELNQLNALERSILAQARLVICTSQFTQNWLSKLHSTVKYLVILPTVPSAFTPQDQVLKPHHSMESVVKAFTPFPPRRGKGWGWGGEAGTLSKIGKKEEKVRLLCVANILPAKGQLTVLQALCASTSRSWQLRLVAGRDVCDTAYLAQIQQAIQANKLEDQVSLIFNCTGSDLVNEYQRADAFVLATQFETYGMALAEARACALPTVVNDVGGVRESTYAPSTIYVDPKSAQAFQQALHQLVTVPETLTAMRHHALAGLQQPSENTDSLSTNTAHHWDAGIESLREALSC